MMMQGRGLSQKDGRGLFWGRTLSDMDKLTVQLNYVYFFFYLVLVGVSGQDIGKKMHSTNDKNDMLYNTTYICTFDSILEPNDP